MSADLKVDSSQFQATLQRAAGETKRTLGVFMNSRMYHIQKTAMENTPVASREKIMADLGAELRSEKVNKKGKTVRRYNYKPAPVVYGIVNWRRKKAGEKALTGAEMAAAAKKLISGRLRAVGSLKSGFKRGLGILGQKIGQATGFFTGPNVKQASAARPAQEGWNPSVEFEYRVTVQKNGGEKQIDPRVVVAEQAGFSKEQSEMMRHLEENVAGALRKAGAL